MTTLPQSSSGGWLHKAATALARSLDNVLITVEGWREKYALQRELDILRQDGELDRSLKDSGIAPSDLPRLLRAHPGTRRQLAEMMQRLGIDRSALPRTVAIMEELRAIEWRCGECADWRQCRHWLASPDAPGSYRAFCPNAAALDELRRDAHPSGEPGGILAQLEAEKGVGGPHP